MKLVKEKSADFLASTELIDRKELARRLNVAPRTVFNLEAKRIISSIKVGRCVRYDWENVWRKLSNMR